MGARSLRRISFFYLLDQVENTPGETTGEVTEDLPSSSMTDGEHQSNYQHLWWHLIIRADVSSQENGFVVVCKNLHDYTKIY